MSFADFLRPEQPPFPENLPLSTVTYTGPSAPFLSSDGAGNIVLGAPLIATSFAAPTGSSSVNFTSGVLVGATKGFPPSGSAIAPEIPLHETFGLAQAGSLLVSDYSSNAKF